MASGNQRAYGGALGTGSDLDLRTVGWRPRSVAVKNAASGDELYWQEGMADASAFKRLAAGAQTLITTGGVTPLSDGFRLGDDSDMNVAGELVHFTADQ